MFLFLSIKKGNRELPVCLFLLSSLKTKSCFAEFVTVIYPQFTIVHTNCQQNDTKCSTQSNTKCKTKSETKSETKSKPPGKHFTTYAEKRWCNQCFFEGTHKFIRLLIFAWQNEIYSASPD